MLISILSKAGCDVVLLQYHGDKGYLNIDPQSALSFIMVPTDPGQLVRRRFGNLSVHNDDLPFGIFKFLPELI